jgi:sugar transferase (PEP-CTERM/EpsH1 system associated)
MTRPLIVHVVYRFGIGGLEHGVVNLINRMPHDRWRHAIVALTDASPDYARRIERTDVELIELKNPPGHLLRQYPRLVRLLRNLQPSIVHTRNLAALEAVVPAWLTRVPVRIHGEHGWDIQDPHGLRRRYRIVRRLYRPFVTRYVALSKHLERYLVAQVGVPNGRVEQIFNGVDTARYRPAGSVRPRIAGCPFDGPDDWIVGTVGRMEPIKDPLNFARAFRVALRLAPELVAARMRLVFVGDGALRSDAQAELDRPGVRDKVWFAGPRDDVAELMRGLDCFVLPSLAEGVSNTILEAMATSLPVVATSVGGNVDLIESGLTGTLVPSADSDALARAMVDYACDAALARRHGKAARQAAEGRFSIERMVADYIELYEGALAAASIPAGDSRSVETRPRGAASASHGGH